jgi:hypothetical protein
MSLFIINIPSRSLKRKEFKVQPTQCDEATCERDAEKYAQGCDLLSENVTMMLDGVAWLLSKNVIVSADNSQEALDKAKLLESSLEFKTPISTI